jgi:hypothetical protein
VVFTIKLYWLRLKAFVARLFTRNQGSKTRSHG